MKCQNPKCKKKGKLRTRRTIASGRTVQRERYCPACGQRDDTVEMFVQDLNETRLVFDTEVRMLRSELQEKTDQLESLLYHFKQIFEICGAGEK